MSLRCEMINTLFNHIEIGCRNSKKTSSAVGDDSKLMGADALPPPYDTLDATNVSLFIFN